ncbi:venom metalloproteinase antarease TserMP_A-like [Ornithodoros turicata]|uniref:venom metalloproteinase antarease TserMP_A-like n=1 Tax=Ornithodoros turicata TaxID=34597 RepID=UPI003139201F
MIWVVGIWVLVVEGYGHFAVGDDVPEGRLVFPQLVQSRSENGAKVLKVADDLVFTLTKSGNIFGENFIVRTFKEDGYTMEEHTLNAADFEKDLYQDKDKMAAVMVKEQEGLQVEGVLGLGLRIRPMPEMERSDYGHVAHVVYEVEEGDSHLTRAVRETSHRAQVSERRGEQYNAVMPFIIYPEIHIISDSTHVSYFKDGMTSAVEYYGIFINAVNLRYQSVSSPEVSLKIMGITLNSEKEDKNYIFPIPTSSTDQIWGVESLYNVTHYIAKKHLYKDYDIVYLTTGLDLLGYEKDGRPESYRGFGFEGTACEYFKTGIGEDWLRRFTGVHTFAHEIAHILGCPHDGDYASTALLNAPGSRHCPWTDGYIMSYKDTGLKHFMFSQCCNDMMSYTARRNPCLREKNVYTGHTNATKFPGEVINLSKQCSWWYPTVNETYAMTNYAMGICRVKCFMPKYYLGWETHTVIPVLDGTPCMSREDQRVYDNKTACYNGVCQKKRKITSRKKQ